MTAYEYANLPEDERIRTALPEELLPEAKKAIQGFLDSDLILAQEVRVGYLFDRKGYINITAVGDNPNPSYQRKDDDMIIQLTLRIPTPIHYAEAPEMQQMTKLVGLATEEKKAAERERLEAEIAADEAKAAEAQKAAERKRAALAELNKEK